MESTIEDIDEEFQTEVIDALERMQNRKPSLKKRALILGLSLLAFAALWLWAKGITEYSVIGLFALLAMLALHEAGHYLGMRHFGAIDFGILLFPLLGAALKGFDRPRAFEESILFLLGLVPGILAGCILGILYWITRDPNLYNAARIFIITNTFLLLPFHPLDGGRILFGILPRKTLKYQWSIQLSLGILLCVVFWNVSYWMAGPLFVMSTVLVMNLYQSNKIAAALIDSGRICPPVEGVIPPEVAPELIARAHRINGSTSAKPVAEYVWNIWLSLRAKQPSRRETIWLSSIYLVTLVVGLGTWIAFFPG